MSKVSKNNNRFRPKYKIKKGDTVVVISGNYRGTEGRILDIDVKKAKVIVEGAAFIKRHTKPNSENPQGGIIKREGYIDMSNVMLIDPKSGKSTRIGRRVEDGKIVRYAKKSGEVID